MAVKFKLVKRNNLGKDNAAIPQKVYARSVYTDKINFNYLLSEIAEAGIPSSQVKAVIDRMNFLISKHLTAGHIVQFGEFGNFRYSLGSTGSETEEEFNSSQIKTPKIIFTPGATLRNAKSQASYQKEVTPEPKPCDQSHI
jgi:predicted histone-like DNA-binding protein